MSIAANNPEKKTWLPTKKQTDFPIQNIPFGVFLTRDNIITIGTRIGDTAIDLGALHQLGYFEEIPLTDDIFLQDSLNDFISNGKKTWRLVRNRISEIFDSNNDILKNNESHRKVVLFSLDEIEMQLPVNVGDYTDFYSSIEHATNVGCGVSRQEQFHYPLRDSHTSPSGTKNNKWRYRTYFWPFKIG